MVKVASAALAALGFVFLGLALGKVEFRVRER